MTTGKMLGLYNMTTEAVTYDKDIVLALSQPIGSLDRP